MGWSSLEGLNFDLSVLLLPCCCYVSVTTTTVEEHCSFCDDLLLSDIMKGDMQPAASALFDKVIVFCCGIGQDNSP